MGHMSRKNVIVHHQWFKCPYSLLAKVKRLLRLKSLIVTLQIELVSQMTMVHLTSAVAGTL